MPSANIEIGGVAASNLDATINTTFALTNADTGGEVTYLWEIVDQPDGTADTITNPTLESASILCRKEGTYLIRLTVNQGGGGTERIDSKIIAVRDMKTGARFPAFSETIQGGVDGWKDDSNGLNNTLRRFAGGMADPMIVSAVAMSASLVAGDIVKLDSRQTIKTGLAGQETLLGCSDALATSSLTGFTLGVVVGPARTGGSLGVGNVLRVRIGGLVATSSAGAPAVGDPVFVSNTGVAALAAGTFSRRVGRVVSVGGGSYFWIVDTIQDGSQLAAADSIGSTLRLSPIMVSGSDSQTRGPVNDEARALYMGRARRSITSIGVRWQQPAGGTIVYAEMGIATGACVPGSTPSLVIRGFVSAATEWGSGGQRQVTVPITGAAIGADEDIWVLYAVNFSAGTPTIIVSSLSDVLSTGQIVKRAACRLSLNLNTAPLAFVNDAATPAWIGLVFP